jgi:arabinogalactan endo-1,4-beta-galactosidase
VELLSPAAVRGPKRAGRCRQLAGLHPISPDGQAEFFSELIDTVRSTPDGKGIGVLYWQPELMHSKTWQERAGHLGAMSLFDADGNILPAMDVLETHARR